VVVHAGGVGANETALGACGNGHGREWESKAIRARAANGARMGVEHGHEWEGADNKRVPTSTRYTERRARMGERGQQGVRLTGAVASISAKSCDHLQQSYTIQCISQNLIYHILWLKITALHMEVSRKFYL
jgi:hypothetical protein